MKKSFFFFFALIFVVWVLTIIFALKHPLGEKEESDFNFATDDTILELDISGYGIYVNNEKIGYSISREKKTESGIRISETSFINISAYGTSQEITTYTVSEADKDLNLKSFYFELVSGKHTVRTKGVIKNDSIFLTTETSGGKKNAVFTLGDKPFVPASLERVAQELKLKEDTVYNYSIFEPTSGEIVDIEIWRGGEESIEMNGKHYTTDVVIVQMLGFESQLYFDKDGKLLMESSPMGITMKREPLEEIANFAKGTTGLKIFETYAIYPEGTINNPRKSHHLIAELQGVAPGYKFQNDERQRYVNGTVTIDVLEPASNFSIEDIDKSKFTPFLESTNFIPCDDKEVINLAKEITGSSEATWEGVEAITDWLYRNIRKSPTFSIPYAKEVIKTRVGDCNEHAVLFCSLTRAIGIPTKVVVGIVYVDGAFYYHAWNEVYWGRWVACDPVFGQHLADATHIKLEEGTLLDFINVVKLVGQLHIKIIRSS